MGSGGFGGGGGASANVTIALKPLSERRISADQVIARLRPKLDHVTGVRTFLQSVQDVRTGGRSANAQYQYTLLGDDLAELRTWSQKLRLAMQDMPEVTDVDSDMQPGGLEADLVVDRDTASRLGLTEIQIDNASAMPSRRRRCRTSTIPTVRSNITSSWKWRRSFGSIPTCCGSSTSALPGGAVTRHAGDPGGRRNDRSSRRNRLPHRRRRARPSPPTRRATSPPTRWQPAAAAIPRRARRSAWPRKPMVPFAAFSHFLTSTTPVSVNHTGTSASTAIAFNLPEGESLSTALAAIDRKMSEIHVPVSIRGGTYGTANLFQQNNSNTPLMLAAALAAIYVVLGVLYESYSQPLTILSTLPSAGVGALLALMATGTEFSLIAFLGILLLIGIVKKNAIMMVDFALDAERTLQMDPRQAIAHACSLRFRPIMMTTCAAIAGALPLAIAYGDGTEMRRPLGIAIVGGLIVSQLLTIYTTPVVYLYVHRYWKRRKRGLPTRRLDSAGGAASGADYGPAAAGS